MKTLADISEHITQCKGAGELLCKSEEMHHVFFEMGAVGMACGDLDGRILHANAKYSEITGYSLAELTQLKFLDLTHPDNLETDRKEYPLLALPLVWKEDCLGALTIYLGRLNAFSPQEVDLLKKIASNLASGIIAQRNRIAREKLQKELLEISEREKQLISQELHDGLCQNLAGTALMSRLLYARLEARNDPDTQYAKEIYDLLGNSVNEARNLSRGLHPVGPHGEGLMNALAQLAGTVRNLFHIDCTFECPRRVTLENETVSTHLFRITQEAINNARKHGEADRVVIGLRCSPKGVTLTIEDNGVGFPVKTPKKSGMGLRIMKHRTAEIGATLSVRRASEDGGTVVTCTLP
ncbi:MAG: ATP-binding protein [Verrucomicrobiota bacterium]